MRLRLLVLTGLTLSAPGAAAPPNASTVADYYAGRIEKFSRAGPRLNAVIAVNPDWREQARALDAERAAGKVRGPLHGQAILIKDNIETADRMATTAGSLALADNVTGRDAPLVARLRKGGALILGKANLSEWANFRSNRSMSGWSAMGGIVRNPYALDRTACGSSSGSAVAVAAGLAWAAIGTETDGSIACPASVNGIVGLKPTLGLISRTHVVPISHTQDTPGPMARTVRDAALLLGAMAGSDPADVATAGADAHKVDYAAALTGKLAGVRIGVLRSAVTERASMVAAFAQALATLKSLGAEIVEISDFKVPPEIGAAEGIVLYSEFEGDLNAYLATTPPAVKARTLEALIAFNTANAARELPYFGQESFIYARTFKGTGDPKYRAALTTAQGGARALLDKLLADNKVAMLIAPTRGPAWFIDPVNGDQYSGPSSGSLSAVAGYPHLTVPMTQISGLPVGLSFMGPAWSEAALLNAGDAFEKARGPLPGPTYRASVPVDR